MDFDFDGWAFLGRFPDEEDGVGSWLLHHGGEAALLELPPGLNLRHVHDGLARVGAKLKYVTWSHSHEDHFDPSLSPQFKPRTYVRATPFRDLTLSLGGEPLFLVGAPKHSDNDNVAIFRGTAMTGDLELGTLDSVNREVGRARKTLAMRYYALFEQRHGYRVNTIVSAHLNDLRRNVEWAQLFTF